jgi:hypothetical protein
VHTHCGETEFCSGRSAERIDDSDALDCKIVGHVL